MAVKSTLKRTGPGLGPIEKAFAQLARTKLLVGVPGDTAPRDPVPGQKGARPSNALIGYMMETGDPEMNLPARPFLVPGVKAALPDVVKGMRRAAVSALSGRPGEIKDGFDQAGLPLRPRRRDRCCPQEAGWAAHRRAAHHLGGRQDGVSASRGRPNAR